MQSKHFILVTLPRGMPAAISAHIAGSTIPMKRQPMRS